MMKFLQNLYDNLIPSYFVDLSIKERSLSVKILSHNDMLEERTLMFNKKIFSLSLSESVDYIFSHLQQCKYVIFFEEKSGIFIQFGVQKHGFFCDFPMNERNGNKIYLPKIKKFLKRNNFHKNKADLWEYKKYFFCKVGDMEIVNIYFKKDIGLIADFITYMAEDVYKISFKDLKVQLG